ncbi:hypothetical protein LguiA_008417 [Lonicera macranthoides]
MELSGQEEGDMPIPINSTYGHGHIIHHEPATHNHIIPQIPSNGPTNPILEGHVPYKKMVIRYKECLKNHAASMGGNATDGCGEFMPSGEEGTLEALNCSVCNCHRNFHRKEIEGDPLSSDLFYHNPHLNRVGRKLILGNHRGGIVGPPAHGVIMSYNMGSVGPSESDEQEGGGGVMGYGDGGGGARRSKKRFRTKFTQEQKEKMLDFAEKVGWKIQKQEESVVQQFCQEVGVKRRVLKVWMHNNKHSLAKKNPSTNIPQDQI